ncbi:MAG TPA: dephospho-CoA kinase [Polyangiaceae bacterium]|nr:dephospho-CoA kinase [Polyangiaceae bacterium]
MPPDVGFILFGLTGGLASGKSSVAARWKARGLPIIDADVMAREIVAPGTPALSEIVAAFGPEVLLADGSLDRKKVGAIVFADPDARKKLELMTHPRIAARMLERAGELEAAEEPLGCYEAPLLVERGFADLCRPLVVVAVDERTQVARAMARDELTEDEVRARLTAQLPLATKIAAADYVIDNSGDLGALIRKADDVLDAICEKAGVDPTRYPQKPAPG